jgi:hypothetical protein
VEGSYPCKQNLPCKCISGCNLDAGTSVGGILAKENVTIIVNTSENTFDSFFLSSKNHDSSTMLNFIML